MIVYPMIQKDDSKKSQRNPLIRVHRLACVIVILLIAYFLLGCIVSFCDALQEMNKFRDLGSSNSIRFYLASNAFGETVAVLLLITIEFLLYIMHCRRVAQERMVKGGMWYFSVLLMLHMMICIHANLLVQSCTLPSQTIMYYRAYANISTLPSAVYCILYYLHLRKSKYESNT